MGSPVGVSRKHFRILLVVLVVISGGMAAWSWLRPYEWGADSKAGCHIVGCQVVRDHSNYWVNLKLKMNRGAEHDDKIPIKLVTSSDREIDADVTLVSDGDKVVREIWLKFWSEKEDLEGPLRLKINEGELSVRKGSGIPKSGADGSRYFVTHNW